MAFMGIFAMAMVVMLVILGVILFIAVVGIILLIVSRQMRKKQLNEKGNGKKTYLVLWILGWICILPLGAVILYVLFCLVSNEMYNRTSLGHHVIYGNYEEAERILKRGVTADCTIESNDPAKPGEQTLLSILCENGGFTNVYGDAVDDVVTADELAMMQLLIDYGADLERVTYIHEKDDDCHRYMEESDYYMGSDECGYTPLLYAVRNGNMETVKLLVENGADVNAKDFCGFNAVATVADNMSDRQGKELLVYLLDIGCDKRAITNFLQDSYFLASRHNTLNNEEIQSMLEWQKDGKLEK